MRARDRAPLAAPCPVLALGEAITEARSTRKALEAGFDLPGDGDDLRARAADLDRKAALYAEAALNLEPASFEGAVVQARLALDHARNLSPAPASLINGLTSILAVMEALWDGGADGRSVGLG